MFAEFMRIQATNTTPKSKSERTADPEIFSGDGGNTEITHEKLESFITSLSLKMTLNTCDKAIAEQNSSLTDSVTLT